MNEISAIIVVKDNPPHLFEAISSVQNLAKEIIVADIGIHAFLLSQLKKNKKITIIPVKKNVPYVELIREELKQYATQSYILFLDPDEIIPLPLKKLLLSVYQDYDFIRIPRKNIIFGKWIEHSRWWPDYQVRLFRKNSVVWPKKIHSQPEVKGNGYTVEPKEEHAFIHHNYESIDEFMQKYIRYAKAEAGELISFTLPDALKKALSEFMSRYFAEAGYKDGVHGFVLAFLQTYYYFLVYVYYWEMKGKPMTSSQELMNTSQLFFRQGLKESNYWMIKEKFVKGKDVIKNKIIGKLLS